MSLKRTNTIISCVRRHAFMLSLFLIVSQNLVAATSFMAGTYNIRLKTAKDIDEYAWDQRKPYVVRTIAECGFDILGLNEMNAGSMYSYLKDELAQHGFDVAVCDVRTNKDLESQFIHPVVYRTSMFDLEDQGVFYLNYDPSTPGISWDCSTSNNRSTHWARMRVKDSGEVFYFFATHLDHLGDIARNEQSRINIEKIKEIASDYPVIICGDHNSSSVRYPFYNLYASYLNDTKVVAEEPFTDAYEGTLPSWNPSTQNNTRLDYVWVRGFSVQTHQHLRETFGRSVLPSDHIPVLVRLTFEDPQPGLWVCHLDPNAPGGGDGSIQAPFSNFTAALEGTRRGGTIKVVAGDFSSQESDAVWEVNKSVSIIGGYNADFSSVIGVTSLNGAGTKQLITVDATSYLELCNFDLSDGFSNKLGGAIYCLGAYLHLKNVSISGCYAETGGGAVYAAQQICADGCRFTGNSTPYSGGAILADFKMKYPHLWWRYFLKDCSFADNSAAVGAAMHVAHFIRCNFFNCSFTGNIATTHGSVSLYNTTAYASEASFANCTFVANRVEAVSSVSDSQKGGAAIFAQIKDGSLLSLANCTVLGNANIHTATSVDDYAASTIQLTGGKLYSYSNLIGGNVTDAPTGYADITAPTVVGAYNCYSCATNITHRKSLTDIISPSNEVALQRLQDMFGCEIDDSGILLPALTDDDGHTLTAVMKNSKYGTDDINCVPKTQFEEALTHADINNDAEYKSALATDQRGIERRKDGTSTIGAVELTAADDLPEIFSDQGSIHWHVAEGQLIASAQSNLALYDLSGALIASSTPTCPMKINLKSGIYILKSFNQAIKIIVK